jgi:hypothetical protein
MDHATTTFVNPFTSDVPSETLVLSLFTTIAEADYKRGQKLDQPPLVLLFDETTTEGGDVSHAGSFY